MTVEISIKFDLQDFMLDVDMTLPGQGISAIFGPSGSGKTTILRIIAGLERHPDVTVNCNGQEWQHGQRFIKPHLRNVGYVFQQPSLFNHLNVRQNIEFAAKRAKGEAVDSDLLVDMLDIRGLLDRECRTLSGGEAQRVAITRALASNPQLLLMDEPLAALDQGLKDEFLPYLERLHQQISIPIIYVSHSRTEVARISDYLVLLEQGRVKRAGNTNDMFSLLDSPLTMDEQTQSIFNGEITEYEHPESYLCKANTQIGELWISARHKNFNGKIRIRILAKDVSVCLIRPEQTSVLNIIPATIVGISKAYQGQVTIKLAANGHSLLSRITVKSMQDLDLKQGMKIFAQVKGVAVVR